MVINKELLSSNAASLGVDLSEDMLDKFDLLLRCSSSRIKQ